MAEFSERDHSEASMIISQLFDRQRERERYPIDLREDIVIFDIERDVNQFSSELEILQRYDAGIPTIRIGEENRNVPVSLRYILGDPWFGFTNRIDLWSQHPYYDEMLYIYFRELRRGRFDYFEGYDTISPNEGEALFKSYSTDFLATRISAIRNLGSDEFETNQSWGSPVKLNLQQTIGGERSNTPGCNFTVSTNTMGLRVFWSGAYYISGNFFSHPTTPVQSGLQSGTYVFGVDGGAYGNVIQWDKNAIIRLPGQPWVHLNF